MLFITAVVMARNHEIDHYLPQEHILFLLFYFKFCLFVLFKGKREHKVKTISHSNSVRVKKEQ